jgi:hypothetical protein
LLESSDIFAEHKAIGEQKDEVRKAAKKPSAKKK